MRKINIKCLLDNYSIIKKFYVIIYDINNNKIFDDVVCNKKSIYINSDCDLFTVYVYSLINTIPGYIKTTFLFENDVNLIFNFFSSTQITIRLVDKNSGIPIERGSIELWQDHTQ